MKNDVNLVSIKKSPGYIPFLVIVPAGHVSVMNLLKELLPPLAASIMAKSEQIL